MPSGYTAAIYDGKKEVTFNEFIMGCARAFGALVTMRHDPSNAPIPDEFKPSDYYDRALDNARVELARVLDWTDHEADDAAKTAYEAEVTLWNVARTEREARRQRYGAMRKKARAWTPPSSDHQELRNFMIQQLTDSIDWDCKDYSHTPVRLSGRDFRALQIATLTDTFNYHEKARTEELEQVANRNKWIKQLRDSLA